MKVKVSVTIPVYNTSKYLRQCLDSLACQTLKEIEFIIVDDGSDDGSGEICDEYALKDNRFRVIHQANGGLAAARQTGLDNASGDYVIVCDSDDWTDPKLYEVLYDSAVSSNADIATCGYFAEYSDGKSVPVIQEFTKSGKYIDNNDFIRKAAGSSWVKLIRRGLFKETGSYYEPGINLGEDSLILYKLLKSSPKIIQSDSCLYHYRRLLGQNTYTNNLRMTHIRQLYFIYKWLCNNYAEDDYVDLRLNRACDLAFACLRTGDTDKKFLKEFLNNELSYSDLIRFGISLKKVMVIGEKILPLDFMKYILRILYPIVYK